MATKEQPVIAIDQRKHKAACLLAGPPVSRVGGYRERTITVVG